MAISFPTSLDSLTNPSSSDQMNTAGVLHDVQHSDLNDAVEALEAKVGINSSAVTTSLDYRMRNQIKTTEVDFGSTGVRYASFTITDTDVSSSTPVVATLSGAQPTSKDQDEIELDAFTFKILPASGSFTLYAHPLEGPVYGKFKVNYVIGWR